MVGQVGGSRKDLQERFAEGILEGSRATLTGCLPLPVSLVNTVHCQASSSVCCAVSPHSPGSVRMP
jgi:hypothetical protein